MRDTIFITLLKPSIPAFKANNKYATLDKC